MAEERITWTYEKLDEKGKLKYLPVNDYDGKETGKIVFGLKAWMDENPEERKRLGWIKHIHYSGKEIKERWPYDHHTQWLKQVTKQVDEWTIEDDYHVMDKSEDMMLLQELLPAVNGDIWYDGDDDVGVRFTW